MSDPIASFNSRSLPRNVEVLLEKKMNDNPDDSANLLNALAGAIDEAQSTKTKNKKEKYAKSIRKLDYFSQQFSRIDINDKNYAQKIMQTSEQWRSAQKLFAQELLRDNPFKTEPDPGDSTNIHVVTADPAIKEQSDELLAVLNSNDNVLSSKEICDAVADAIAQMDIEYIQVHQSAVEKYLEFWTEVSDLVTNLSNHVGADEDKTVLAVQDFGAEVDKLITKYSVSPYPNNNATLYPIQDSSKNGTAYAETGASKEECEAWAKQFGLDPDACVKRTANGKYVVVIDTRPLESIRESLPGEWKYSMLTGWYYEYDKDKTYISSEWSAWQTGFELQKSNMQTTMQATVQNYSSANSTFDNLVKVLSSTISSLLETDKAFLV